MTSQETLRRGTTFTHHGERFTVHRVMGGTVVAHDSHGHTRHLWTAEVLEAIHTAAGTEALGAESAAEVTIRGCESFGVAAPRPATAPSPEPADAAEYLRVIEEYRREVLGDRSPRRPLPARACPVVHLFGAPETTPPHAA